MQTAIEVLKDHVSANDIWTVKKVVAAMEDYAFKTNSDVKEKVVGLIVQYELSTMKISELKELIKSL